MYQTKWKNNITEIYNSLEKNELKNAFDLLKPLISEQNDWESDDLLNQSENTYKTMLHYLQDGINDPSRKDIYLDLLRSTYQLTDHILFKYQLKNGSDYFFERKRIESTMHPESIDSLITRLEDISGKIALNNLLENTGQKGISGLQFYKEKESIEIRLFRNIWLSEIWNKDTKDQITGVIYNKVYPVSGQCLIISGITLSLQNSFDKYKILALLDTCENENPELSLRAITGLLLSLRKYDKRIHLYPEIIDRLNHLAEQKSFIINVRNIILQFILSKDTEKITRKITEEILPEMKKINPILSKKIKLDNLMGESGLDDKNPEWQNIIEESGLSNKLQEFSEMQMEGADVMHSSFSYLKTYSFFNEISNWFLPFTKSHSLFTDHADDETENKLLDAIIDSRFLCNSDKYSLYLSFFQMPQSLKKMFSGQFAEESAAFNDMRKSELPDNTTNLKEISGLYIRDLYRFYKLHPNKSDFPDIFETESDLYQTKTISNLIPDTESLTTIGEYYFNRNYYKEAAEVFDMLLAKAENVHSGEIYQKKGYCMQMQNRLEEALDSYLKAELYQSDNSWTIKKIAYCYRALKKPEEALLYYKKAEQASPDNLSIQLNIGHCYLELKNYTEALKSYFKVEYLDSNGSRAWRPIAWCSFLTGKYEQSCTYFEKIMETDKADAGDYLNAGHVQLARNHVDQAIHLYIRSVQHPESSLQHFEQAFNNDIPELIHAGISIQEIHFILDLIRYNIK